jgi:hypothetical protein
MKHVRPPVSPKPPVPPVPPPIDYSRISHKAAIELTAKARQKLFEAEKGKTYQAIYIAADKGSYYVQYKFLENCNIEDIEKLRDELIEKGFKVKHEYSVYGDKLEISWYPEDKE